jgi:hypothetical protein
MDNHVDFWVVIGTAAPVIGLAFAIAVGNVARAAARHPTRDIGTPTLAMLGFIMCGFALALSVAALGGGLIDEAVWRWIAGLAVVLANSLLLGQLIKAGFKNIDI